MATPNEPGTLSWRLSSHPMTLLSFLTFRISSLLVYLLGLFFTENYILIFIITMLLLSVDFYHIKNIAGRRLVGLRWWNEVNPETGDTKMVFESLDPATRPRDEGGRPMTNATDRRFFWLGLYAQPVLWVGLAIVAVFKVELIWLTLVGMYCDDDSCVDWYSTQKANATQPPPQQSH